MGLQGGVIDGLGVETVLKYEIAFSERLIHIPEFLVDG